MTEKLLWKHNHRRLKAEEASKEFENWEKKDLIKEILDLRDQLVQLLEEIETLKKGKSIELPVQEKDQFSGGLSKTDFKSSWSYPTKVAFLLIVKGNPMTTEEIHGDLLLLDKLYSIYTNPKATLSVYLTNATKTGRIKAVKLPGIKMRYFSLPEWLNEKGGLKEAHRIDPSVTFK
jgi:hypothetical protein